MGNGKHGNGWVSEDCEKVVVSGLETAARRMHSPEAMASAHQLGDDIHKGKGPYDSAGLIWGIEGALDKLGQSKDPKTNACVVDVKQDIQMRGITLDGIHGADSPPPAKPPKHSAKGHRPG